MSALYRTTKSTTTIDEDVVAKAITSLALSQRAAEVNRERAESPQFTPAQMLELLVEICVAAKVSPTRVPTLAALALNCGFAELERAEAAHAQLVKLLGAEADIADHGRLGSAGTEFVPLALIAGELDALRESLRPFERFRPDTRRAAA